MAKTTRREVSRSINQYGVFPVTVSRIQQLSPHFVRISLTGRSLLHAAEPIADGTGRVFDAYIKLLVPPPGASGPTMIELDESWRQRWFAAPAYERGHMRTYTVRHSRLVPSVGFDETPLLGMFPAAAADLTPLERPLPAGVQPEIDIDFVLHGPADSLDTGKAGESTGPGSTWAATAQIGQQVSILAPLYGSSLWSSWNPGAAHRLLLLGDETAAPAVLSILRSLPAGARGTAILETPDDDDLTTWAEVKDAASRLPELTLRWAARPPGHNRGEALIAHLRQTCGVGAGCETALEFVASDEIVWQLAENPQGSYVFIAGESSLIKTLRRICVNEAKIPKHNISFMGYWKAGQAES
ncbi:siderophore-interacting protein [Rothia nasimurium]|uniref:siderophore-interacting protein n=1 Tax=Rothia nasimurium TaxID=85336 RepID=UPI001F4637E8|nr:siderophore-interacting protein [Rothia nasimurium]